MKRVAYDADTERYTFREGNELWIGEPRAYYGGTMKFLRTITGDDEEEEEEEEEEAGELSTRKHSSLDSHVTRVIKQPIKAPNEWGVYPVSITDTDAPLVDTPGPRPSRSKTLFRKAATSTVTAIRATRRWSESMKKRQGHTEEDDSDERSSIHKSIDFDTEKPPLPEKDY
ncbi:hypothetical protein M422DRAFT_72382 [Sphaerobolus stellatus SS14]|uniref:Uncharacterized protein n=1 Tax=Sphaerobolus stellatus (strain SS14) TaxID=990650 RepID=A0A0C9UGI5_SPHS4|nr:hypothetical protein M422DRAFT_72382 [Sphaerobolus stellatus SS14]